MAGDVEDMLVAQVGRGLQTALVDGVELGRQSERLDTLVELQRRLDTVMHTKAVHEALRDFGRWIAARAEASEKARVQG